MQEGTDDAAYTPTVGFEDAYEITTSGDYHVRSLSSGRTMKITPAGWVILRDPDTRAPIRVHVSTLRHSNGQQANATNDDNTNTNTNQRGRTSRFKQLIRLVAIVASISVFIHSMNSEGGGGGIDLGIGFNSVSVRIKESLRQYAISWLQYLLEWLEGGEYCWRTYPWRWADDMNYMNDRVGVRNHSL